MEITLMNLLPNLSTAHPAKGSAMNEPRGSMKSTAPSSASLSLNVSLNTGMRDAQHEKIKPQKKNRTATAYRAILILAEFNSMINKFTDWRIGELKKGCIFVQPFNILIRESVNPQSVNLSELLPPAQQPCY
jgi:hypothetical protein